MLEKLMKFKASKKTSLLLSLFCILMCVTVLIGTSFAWFTDTVTSGSNRIQTGTLKVGMDYRTVNLGAASAEWTDANGAGNILDENALYEPGYVSMTLFRIENKGTLSFKYQFALKLAEQQGINVFGEPFKLSDYLSFNLIPLTGEAKAKALSDNATYGRADALALVGDNPVLGYNVQNTVDAVMPVKENGDANDKYDVIALVIYMPETVGNKAMYDTTAPSISLDFKLVATQYTDEKDSFDQYYDEKAVYNDEDNPVRPNWTAFQYIKGNLANTLVCYDGTGFPVVRVTSANAGTATLIVSECNAPIGFNVTAGTIYKSYNISVVNDNGDPVDGNFTVQMYVGEGYEADEISLYHNGQPMAFNSYSNGYVEFTTDSFSVFTAAINAKSLLVTNGDEVVGKYNTVAEAIDAAPSGSTIKLTAKLNEITSTITIPVDKDITIDLNGCAIKTAVNRAILNKGKLTIKDTSNGNDGVVYSEGEIALEADSNDVGSYIDSYGELSLESGRIVGFVNYTEKKVIHMIDVYNGGVFKFTGGEIDVKSNSDVAGSSIVGIYCRKDSTLNMSDGKLTVTSTNVGSATGITAGQSGSAINISGGSIDVYSHNTSYGINVSGESGNCAVSNCTINVKSAGDNKAASKGITDSGAGDLMISNVSINVDSTGPARGIEFTGTGKFNMNDDASVNTDRNKISIKSGAGVVGIYFASTSDDIQAGNFDIDVVGEAGTIHGIQNRGSNVVISGSASNKNTITMHGMTNSVNGISSQDSNGKITVSNTKVAIYGNAIYALNASQSGEIAVTDCDFVTSAPSLNPCVFCSKTNAKIIVNGGNTIDATNTNGGKVTVITTDTGGTVTFNSGTAPATAQGGHLTWSN